MSTTLAGTLHDGLVSSRRAAVLAKHLAARIPRSARVLDVGCGDGLIDTLIQEIRPDVSVEGIDVLVRPNTKSSVKSFDGFTIPYTQQSFDVTIFVDVLHHTLDPAALLKEAARVAGIVVIKDHCRDGWLSSPTLRFMDWFGNAHHGVALPYNYWSSAQWDAAFARLSLAVTDRITSLSLYPPPASWVFERGLHFVAKLERRGAPVD